MAYGLRTFDGFGNLIVDITDRLTRYVASAYVSLGPQSSTFVFVSGMSDDGTWAVIGMQNFLGVKYGNNGFTVSNSSASSTVAANLYIFRV